MRHVTRVLGLAVVLVAVGCSASKWGMVRNPVQGPMSSETPSAAALVKYLGDNARQIQSLDCKDLTLDCKQGSGFKVNSVGLTGKMVCQKPRSFRLAAYAVGSQQVDVGSNDQEFWYWIAKADPPYLYRCSYQDFARGVRMPFPFQPEWIMDALGMGEPGPVENYQLVVHPNTLELVQQTVSAQGVQMRKVTEFGRDRSQVQVRGYKLQDAGGKDIYTAQITDVQAVGGAVIPRRIVFHWPAEQIEMVLRLGHHANDVIINGPIDGQRAAGLFTRPNLANVPTVDLAGGFTPTPGPIRRAGGAP
jgi:hypothetical protein